MTEHYEPVDGEAVETVEIGDDGAVVDTVVVDTVGAVVDEEGAVEEIVATHVVETEILERDGSAAEIVETDVVEVVLDRDGEVVEVVETREVDTVVIDADGEVTEVVATGTVIEDADGVVTEVVEIEVDDADDADDVEGADGSDADALADTRLEALDDGSAAVAGAEAVVGSPEALPFEMPARERFAALVDVEPTGDPRVDAATARLDEVPDLPTSEHVEVYEDVHARLQDALSDTEVR